MGACDVLTQDGIFSSLAIIPADRFQDVGEEEEEETLFVNGIVTVGAV